MKLKPLEKEIKKKSFRVLPIGFFKKKCLDISMFVKYISWIKIETENTILKLYVYSFMLGR